MTNTPKSAATESGFVEDDASVAAWADATFGPTVTALSIAKRAREEMDELIDALEEDDEHPKAAEEAADIVIILARLFVRRGTTQRAEVSRKMAVNRQRKWSLTGTGHGYHIKETPPAPPPSAVTAPDAELGPGTPSTQPQDEPQ